MYLNVIFLGILYGFGTSKFGWENHGKTTRWLDV
jgi:hypothetical protein